MDDSDNDDEKKLNVIEKVKTSVSSNAKKRRIIDSSDEEETISKNATISSKVAKLSLKASENKKMKAVNVANVFGDEPIKRVEKEKKPKKTAEKQMLDNATDDIDLIDIDETVILSNGKNTNQKHTPKKQHKVKDEKKTPKKDSTPRKVKNEEKTPIKVKDEKKTPTKIEKLSPMKQEIGSSSATKKKREQSKTPQSNDSGKNRKQNGTPSSGSKRKKQNNDESQLDTSVYDPDQEKHEKRRAAAVLYKQFQKRKEAGPSNPGSKEIPKGKPNCFNGLAFVLTGVFESMERDEAASVIKELGGRVTSAISGKTNYVVAGEDCGPAKIAKAEDLNIPVLTEDDLLDLIREKSDLPTLNKKKQSTEDELSPKSPKKQKKNESSKAIKRIEPSPNKESPKKPKLQENNSTHDGNYLLENFQCNSLFILFLHVVSENKIKKETSDDPEKAVSLAWVDKYKPKTIKDIIGQQGPASNCSK